MRPSVQSFSVSFPVAHQNLTQKDNNYCSALAGTNSRVRHAYTCSPTSHSPKGTLKVFTFPKSPYEIIARYIFSKLKLRFTVTILSENILKGFKLFRCNPKCQNNVMFFLKKNTMFI